MSLRNFSMDEWDSMSDEMKLLAAVSAGSRIRELEICAGDERRLLDETRDHADIQRRRIEITQFILHEDCMKDRLEKVAAILWPSPASVIDKPTEIPLHDREPDFYVTPTWGEVRGRDLVNTAAALLSVVGSAMGSLWIDEYRDWKVLALAFVKKFDNE